MSQPTPTGPSAYGPPPAGQFPAGQFPAGPPMPPTRRTSWFARHKVLTGLGAAAVLIVVIAVVGGGDDDQDPPTATAPTTATAEQVDPDPAQEEPAAPTNPGLNEPAADGKFSFVVTGVETGLTQVGNAYLNSQAQGQYVLVHLTVTNTGTEPQFLFAGSQEGADAQGRTFSVDSTATIYAGESDVWASEINPGNQVTGTLVFDIPADATLSTLTLHDSPFSGGVTVRLG